MFLFVNGRHRHCPNKPLHYYFSSLTSVTSEISRIIRDPASTCVIKNLLLMNLYLVGCTMWRSYTRCATLWVEDVVPGTELRVVVGGKTLDLFLQLVRHRLIYYYLCALLVFYTKLFLKPWRKRLTSISACSLKGQICLLSCT